MAKRILIMAGGTGGHVIPALAVAEELMTQGWQVEWLGTQKGIEAKLVPAANIKLNCLSIAGLRGKGKLSLIKAPFNLLFAVGQALAVIKRFKPDVVLGLGGFASGPGGIAAKLAGKPLVIHEQNAYAGMTNRYLAKVAKSVLQAFDGALDKGITVGNPTRAAMVAWTEFTEPKVQAPYKVLVVGGSLGALAINQTMPEAARLLIDAGIALDIRHQCGAKHVDKTQEFYDGARVSAAIEPFIDDMAAAYRWADLVVCRAGALTVSEIAMAGSAALFIPFPFAVDDHQTANANWLVKQGGGEIMQQQDMTANTLAEKLKQMLQREALVSYAQNAWAMRQPSATQKVAQVCKELAGES